MHVTATIKSRVCVQCHSCTQETFANHKLEKNAREQNCKHCVTPWRWLNVAIKSRLCDKLMNWNGLKGWNEIERTKRGENFYQRQLNFVLTNARCIFLSKQTKKKNSATCLLIKTFGAKSMKTLNKQIWKWAFKD